MKTLALSAALLCGLLVSNAHAQYVTYYAPAAPVVAPAYYAAPYYVRPRRAYYAPVVAAPVVTAGYYAPAAPVYAGYASAYPYAVARPVVVGRTIYGTGQVYVPGQPVVNTWRAITP